MTAPTPTQWQRALCNFRPAAAIVALALPGAALAEPCGDLTDAVVVSGSSAVKPLLAHIGQRLHAEDDGLTLYYDPAGSCEGVDALLSPDSFSPTTLLTWNASGEESTCDVPLLAQWDSRVGISDVFPATCRNLPNGLPSNVFDFRGPIQTMVFAVPAASEQEAISAEAAYNVFGFGSDSGVAPWTQEEHLVRRSAQSGTQRMIAAAIGVPAHRFRGVVAETTGSLAQRLVDSGASEPDASLGVLSAGAVAASSSELRALAFQDFSHSCAFPPDATPSSNDKLNVRNGDYPIWGPLHLLVNVDGSGRPTTLGADRVVQFVLGLDTSREEEVADAIELEAALHLVPRCAMRVARDSELGPLSPHRPAQPCGCYFEALANGSTSCVECQSNVDCAAVDARCHYGYCETPTEALP